MIDKYTLSDKNIFEFRDFIYKKCGIYYTDAKKYIIQKILSDRFRENNINSFEEYMKMLVSSVKGKQEFQNLLDAVTINETFFYRDENQYETLLKYIIPSIISERKDGIKNLNIWSAACSSGEEPYTLAMIVSEVLGIELRNWNVQILATDISPSILKKAQDAIYQQYSLRRLPKYMISKYFHQNSSVYKVKEEVKKLVRFKQMNLHNRFELCFVKNMDIILCKNVLIYFDAESKKGVLSSLYNSLRNDGMLFLGACEKLIEMRENFMLIPMNGAFAYQKLIKA